MGSLADVRSLALSASWQHYEFGGDKVFLRDTAYPLMKGAAEFCLDFLIDDGKGHLVAHVHFARKQLRHNRRPAFRGEHGQLDGPGAGSRPVHALHRRRKDLENR